MYENSIENELYAPSTTCRSGQGAEGGNRRKSRVIFDTEEDSEDAKGMSSRRGASLAIEAIMGVGLKLPCLFLTNTPGSAAYYVGYRIGRSFPDPTLNIFCRPG